MEKIKISIISYLNTKPFLYGISQSEYLQKNAILEYDFPSACAQKLINRQSTIGIVPIASIPLLPEHRIISEFCISTEKTMSSVLLCSHVPLTEIKTILLDYQSMTSVNLAKILIKNYWKTTPSFIQAAPGYENQIEKTTGGIIIGDRALSLAKRFPYTYDLASTWYDMTGKPFVFACWIAVSPITSEFEIHFNEALKYGISKSAYVATLESQNPEYRETDVLLYLTHELQYNLTKARKESVSLYLEYLAKL